MLEMNKAISLAALLRPLLKGHHRPLPFARSDAPPHVRFVAIVRARMCVDAVKIFGFASMDHRLECAHSVAVALTLLG